MTTIADVARAAGVSISTVSYVMSGKRTISQDTRERVEQAIAELNYSPHSSARSLASRSTQVLGLQAPLRSGVDVHVVMEIVAGVVREAREHQYDILLLTSDDAAGLARAARSKTVDALLVMDIESHDPRITSLEALSIPSVLIGLPDGAEKLSCVDFDFEAAGRLAASHLAELGHSRVALIGAPAEVLERHTSYADRLIRGFLTACDALGLEGTVHPCPSSAEASAVVDEVLGAHPEVTGVLFHNEGALPHVAARLIEASCDVIALCPLDVARTVPGLTDVIDIPAEKIGATATRAAMTVLGGEAHERVQLIAPRLASGGASDGEADRVADGEATEGAAEAFAAQR